jgi:ribonuclease VapC
MVAALAFQADDWREAVDAFRRFGRGRHRAALNFGDCLAYAIARTAGRPLLYVSADFAATDLPT